MLALRGLTKHYAGKTLFEGVSLNLEGGRRYGIVKPLSKMLILFARCSQFDGKRLKLLRKQTELVGRVMAPT